MELRREIIFEEQAISGFTVNTIEDTDPNPHIDILQSINGIKKLYSLFSKTKDKQTNDTVSICIGKVFHAKKIPDMDTQVEVITHLKRILSDLDKWTQDASKFALIYLVSNESNYKLVMNSINIKVITKTRRIVQLSELNSIPNVEDRPHFGKMQAQNVIEKLYIQYLREDVTMKTKNKAVICIGRMYQRLLIPEQMRVDIINHLKRLVRDDDRWVGAKATVVLMDLAYNPAEIDIEQFAEERRQTVAGDEMQKQKILLRKQAISNFLNIILQCQKDGLCRSLIKSGVIECYFHAFDSYDLQAIIMTFIITFRLFANLYDINQLQLLISKKPYLHLFRLLNHTSYKFIFRVINVIFTILVCGTKTITTVPMHPQFAVIQQFKGIYQLYKLFKKIEAKKFLRVKVGICLCLLFRTQEVPKKLNEKIFPILESLSYDPEKSNQIFAKNVLNALAKNFGQKYELDTSFLIEVVSSCKRTRIEPTFQHQFHQQKEIFPTIVCTSELYEEEFVIRNTLISKNVSYPVAQLQIVFLLESKLEIQLH
ncbi:MAG: hypothetical protein EZS28_005740 [Streblomastix strix]|uniref:Condensin complex subunit 1 C-terminal domain-containing protein n=1 Tax=Streblomastix strix TaxID=222440 RepID=A0A5J4WUY3_9EUKA|nr:MAG: hypothetical protein EZS28_005740 [Streblomastix strix]